MSHILESLENARQERQQNALPSSSVKKPDKVSHVAQQSDPEYGIILNPLVWLIVLISIFSAVFIAMQYDVDGPELMDMFRRLLADL